MKEYLTFWTHWIGAGNGGQTEFSHRESREPQHNWEMGQLQRLVADGWKVIASHISVCLSTSHSPPTYYFILERDLPTQEQRSGDA